MNRIKHGHSHATTVIACLALFLALTGGAFAAVKLGKNAVKTKSIKNGAVTTKKIKNGAVTAAKLASGAVKASDIGNGSITGAKLADGSVGKTKFAASGVASGPTSGTYVPSPNNCFTAGFAAPGVQPGDVIFFSVAESPVTSFMSVMPASNTVPAPNVLNMAVCNNSNSNQTFAPNSTTISYVAVR